MNSDLQLTLLLKRQAEDVIFKQIYERNSNVSLVAWREYREEVRKRIYPKPPESNLTQESDDFQISPYKKSLDKYRDNLVQQKHMRSLRMEALSPKASMKKRSSSAPKFTQSEPIQNSFPLSLLLKLEKAVSNANLNKASREYCIKLRSLANTIIDKLNE